MEETCQKKIHIFQEEFWKIFFPIPVLPQILQKLEKMTDSVLPLPVMFFLSHGIFFFIFFLPLLKQMSQIKPKLQDKVANHLVRES